MALDASAAPELGWAAAATNTTLVGAAAGGDQAAWDELVDRFSGTVWAIARAFRLSASDAADVSQAAWLRLVEHLDRIEQPERVGAWLATTTRREALRVIRQGKRQVPTADEIVIDLTDHPSDGVDQELLAGERDRALWNVFMTLPPRCQLLLRLLTSESRLSYRDVGRALEMPVGSIGPTRARCLEHLRRLVEESELLAAEDLR